MGIDFKGEGRYKFVYEIGGVFGGYIGVGRWIVY